jgi:hypothetical protein
VFSQGDTVARANVRGHKPTYFLLHLDSEGYGEGTVTQGLYSSIVAV